MNLKLQGQANNQAGMYTLYVFQQFVAGLQKISNQEKLLKAQNFEALHVMLCNGFLKG